MELPWIIALAYRCALAAFACAAIAQGECMRAEKTDRRLWAAAVLLPEIMLLLSIMITLKVMRSAKAREFVREQLKGKE